MLSLKARFPAASSKTSCNFKSGKPWSFPFRFKIRWRSKIRTGTRRGCPLAGTTGIVTEIVPCVQPPALSTAPCPKGAEKIVRKGLDFFWEQSVTGPTAGSAKSFPRIPPRRTPSTRLPMFRPLPRQSCERQRASDLRGEPAQTSLAPLWSSDATA